MWRLQHVMFDYQKGIVTAGTRTATHTWCEPAQSKRMSRCHKSHFILKFTGKMPGPRVSTSTGLNSYRKSPSVWTHCLGKIKTNHWKDSTNPKPTR